MQRYDLEDVRVHGEPWRVMIAHPDGEWVRYEDARQVEVERDEARREIERLRRELVAATDESASNEAFNAIAAFCGCPHWEYPGQVVRDVETLAKELGEARRIIAEIDDAYKEGKEMLMPADIWPPGVPRGQIAMWLVDGYVSVRTQLEIMDGLLTFSTKRWAEETGRPLEDVIAEIKEQCPNLFVIGPRSDPDLVWRCSRGHETPVHHDVHDSNGVPRCETCWEVLSGEPTKPHPPTDSAGTDADAPQPVQCSIARRPVAGSDDEGAA